MTPSILLVNPPVYDFTAYDFWLRPYGLLRVGGMLRGQARLDLFDFMDRADSRLPPGRWRRSDAFGRGQFHSRVVETPAALADVPRRYRRFGLPREAFRQFLADRAPADFVLVGTGMTYWYLGVREVIEEVRAAWPAATIVLGGLYATLCPDHAAGLGGDLVIRGDDLSPLWRALGAAGRADTPPLWEAYESLAVGALKITRGCPFRCTYCAVPLLGEEFSARPLAGVLADLEVLAARGARDVAFYDDALLHKPEEALLPLLDALAARSWRLNFHTPNPLHARLLTGEVARRMIAGGYRTFYLGLESRREDWQRRTGGKLAPADLEQAVGNLAAAGADPGAVTAYVILGHPDHDGQDVAGTIAAAAGLGVPVMLAEFSPIPGTGDFAAAGAWTTSGEPLSHNKTAFAIRRLGFDRYNALKALSREGVARARCRGLRRSGNHVRESLGC